MFELENENISITFRLFEFLPPPIVLLQKGSRIRFRFKIIKQRQRYGNVVCVADKQEMQQ